MEKKTFYIDGMSCAGCESALEKAVLALQGVFAARADSAKGRLRVEFDAPCTEALVEQAVQRAGYSLAEEGQNGSLNGVYILVILLGLFVIGRELGAAELFSAFPTVGSEKLGYAALFVIGLMTSVHCIAMCGGISLSQSISGRETQPLRRSLLYNLGRLLSYTLIGGALGLLGEVAAITLQVRGAIGLGAGILMLLMGVNMLGSFGLLKRLTPHLPRFLTERLSALGRHGPFAVGLVNGLMPCGPLQSMQIYAIASGGLMFGALSMFFFCLGTIPLVLLFGALAGKLRLKWKEWMLQFGAALLVMLGLFMVQNNLALVGVSLPGLRPAAEGMLQQATVDGERQYLTTHLKANGYHDIQVKAGIPLMWTIIADEGSLNGCNNSLVFPAFDKQIHLSEGETVITFLPEKEGTYSYSCWMGMLKNTITVR